MPVAELAGFDLSREDLDGQDWSHADLYGESLRGAIFKNCNFSHVSFEGTDLSGAHFQDCQFDGANPELAASLDGTVLRVEGLSEAQRAACVARGATVIDDDDDEMADA
jgi:uncharacterized protein YjbI with pentapeptide repeats